MMPVCSHIVMGLFLKFDDALRNKKLSGLLVQEAELEALLDYIRALESALLKENSAMSNEISKCGFCRKAPGKYKEGLFCETRGCPMSLCLPKWDSINWNNMQFLILAQRRLDFEAGALECGYEGCFAPLDFPNNIFDDYMQGKYG